MYKTDQHTQIKFHHLRNVSHQSANKTLKGQHSVSLSGNYDQAMCLLSKLWSQWSHGNVCEECRPGKSLNVSL
jgi:hypothetical protein